MAYSSRLIHRAKVERPTVSESPTGVAKSAYATVSGMESVACLLIAGDAARIARTFGVDIDADAVVLFLGGTDVRPNTGQSDGKNDRLVITDEANVTTTWMVLSTKTPAGARLMTMAAVKRVGK